MKHLLFILTLCGLAHATGFNVTAVRIDGNGTVPSSLTGVGTLSGTTLTASSGTFTSGEVGSGIIFNGVVCGITAFTSSTVVTLSGPCTAATAQAWTVLTSACYNSVTVSCNGWVVEVDISTVATGGTYAMGFTGATNKPTNPSIVLTVTSKGYNNAGSATTYNRTCYGTKALRQAYPTGTVNDEVSSGGTFTTRLAISCFPYDVPIFSSDSVTAVIASAFYTDGSSNTNNSFSGSVTNNSTLPYSTSRAIFNWTYPGWQLITASPLSVRGTGFASSAWNGYPLAVLIFTAADQHNNVATQTINHPTIDGTLGDKAKIIEYIGSLNISSFTNHDQILTCYRAYPWLGDETAIMDSCDQTVTGSVTSGAFVANEQVKQGTSNVLAYLDNVPTGSGNMTIGSIISQTSAADSTHTWIGQTSGAVYTPTAAPTLVTPQPSPLNAPQYYLYDSTNAYTASAYVDGSATYPGSHTSGTFVAGEKVTQSTSNAVAYLIDVTGANGAGPIHVGQIVSGTPNATNGSTWTGATSGAVFTQTAGGTNAGADTNACAVATSSYNSASPPPACLTINGAAVKVQAYNNASATPTHADMCGYIYLNQGYYNWTGASASTSNVTGKCWATITPNGSVTQAQVVIDQTSGTENLSNGSRCTSGSSTCGTPVHLKNLTVNIATSPVSDFDLITYLWFDNVSFKDDGGTAPIYRDTIVDWTDSTIPSTVGGNGLGQFSNVNMAPALLRGNDLTTVISHGVPVYTMVGNTNTASGNCYTLNEYPSATAPASSLPIFAFNTLYNCTVAVNVNLTITQNLNGAIGAAIIQNIFENIGTNESAPIVKIAGDQSQGTPTNNIMIWHNTIVGGRMNRAYNDGNGAASPYIPLQRVAWSEIGNIVDEVAMKTDTFTGGAANGARDGDWFEINAGGIHYDIYPDLTGGTTGWPSSGTFCLEFGGVYSYQPTITSIGNSPANCNTNSTINYPSYKNRQAYDGTNGNSGNGDYNLLSNSPAINFILQSAQVLPYDIQGQLYNNSGWGSSGAFAQEKVLTPVFF